MAHSGQDQSELEAASSGPNETDPIPAMGGRTRDQVRLQNAPDSTSVEEIQNEAVRDAVLSGNEQQLRAQLSAAGDRPLSETEQALLVRARRESEENAAERQVEKDAAVARGEEEKAPEEDGEWTAYAPKYENQLLSIEEQALDKFGGYEDKDGTYHDKFGGVYDDLGYTITDQATGITARTLITGTRIEKGRDGHCRFLNRDGSEKQFSEGIETDQEKEAQTEISAQITKEDLPEGSTRVDAAKAQKAGAGRDIPEIPEKKLLENEAVSDEIIGDRKDEGWSGGDLKRSASRHEISRAKERVREKIAEMREEKGLTGDALTGEPTRQEIMEARKALREERREGFVRREIEENRREAGLTGDALTKDPTRQEIDAAKEELRQSREQRGSSRFLQPEDPRSETPFGGSNFAGKWGQSPDDAPKAASPEVTTETTVPAVTRAEPEVPDAAAPAAAPKPPVPAAPRPSFAPRL